MPYFQWIIFQNLSKILNRQSVLDMPFILTWIQFKYSWLEHSISGNCVWMPNSISTK